MAAASETAAASAQTADHLQALHTLPASHDEVRALAWVLATHDDPRVRDGKLALRLAQHLCRASDHRRPEDLRALAAAYAEQRLFTAAGEAAGRAVAAAEQIGDLELAEHGRQLQRLALARLPLRDGLGEPFTPYSDDPTSAEVRARAFAHVAAAARLLAQDKTDAALASLRRAIWFDRSYWLPHRELGLALLRQEHAARALPHLRTAAELGPHDPLAAAALGLACQRAGNIDDAIAAYRKAYALRPDWLHVANDLAWLLAAQASAEPEQADEAVRIAQQACRAAGRPQPALLDTLAAAYASAGRFDEAVEALSRAAALAGTEAPANPSRFARLELYRTGVAIHEPWQVATFLGQRALADGRLEEAAEHFTAARRAAPRQAEPLLFLARIAELRRDWAQAMEHSEAALRLVPHWAEVINGLAWLYATCPDAALRRPRRAVALAEQVCEGTDYRDPRALDTLAAALAAAGDFPRAVAAADRALEHQADTPAHHAALQWRHTLYAAGLAYVHDTAALLAAGRSHCGNGEMEIALACFRLAAGLDHDQPQAWLHVALVERMRGDLAAAAEAYQRALELRSDPAVQNDLAWIYATAADSTLRRPREALRLALAAHEQLASPPPAALDTLAAAYAAVGRFDEAVRLARQAVQCSPAGDSQTVARRRRLETYQAAKPYIEPAQPPPAP